MLKYLIFFTLILFIKNNNLTQEEKNYLLTINELTTKTKDDIKKDFEGEIKNLKKYFDPDIKTFLKDFTENGFNIKENVTLKVLIDQDEDKSKMLIPNYIKDICDFKTKKRDVLVQLFMNKIMYSNSQWSKYDLLLTKGKKINSLSIFTKKIDKNYMTVYVKTWNRISYPKGLILINNSINEDNPFNNKYVYSLFSYIIDRYLEYSSLLLEPLIRVLVKYYSILSYYAIAEAIHAKFVIPFE